MTSGTGAVEPQLVALAGEGTPASRADWEHAAAAVLRRARRLTDDDPDTDVWRVLATTTLDGIAVPPLGTGQDAAELGAVAAPGQFPYTRGRLATRPAHGWDIRCHLGGLSAEGTREAALIDLEGGVTSLWLTVGGPLETSGLSTALEGVLLDLAPVVLDSPTDPVGTATAFTDLLAERATTAAPSTNLGADPIGARLRDSALREHRTEPAAPADAADPADILAAVSGLAREHDTLAVVVDATVVHDLGASDGQELGYSLAVGVTYLRALTAAGLPVDQALALMEFRYAATDEQFATIAKLRAARRLWARVAELSQASPEAAAQRQHAVTSRVMTSTRDPYVNMLRTTVAAFAAGVGGADAVTVLPFDAGLGQPSSLGRRNARNTSSLLVWESHVAAVLDPAGGSFAVERLTDALARAAWAEFGRIESSGGAQAAIDDGSLVARVAEVSSRRDDDVAHRRRPITGLSEFPNPGEPRLERPPDPTAAPVRRYGWAFEQLRDDPVDTPVFLATLGTVAAHTARATFATNLFAAGGIPVVSSGPTDGVESVLAAYDGQPVVCLCGTDAAYAQSGVETVEGLRAAGARWVVLAGRPGPRTVAAELVDDQAAVGVDALTLLRTTREKLA
ncbi:MAG: methylmalonyl-CoA mutase family protein [Humibacillus sp.]|nr:methylmalonyl-CoA mutase family protein [Humibacillus sp.]MDN5779261.1 methylmalonyl-CoA mutase family protein [Humibacillus sp.]